MGGNMEHIEMEIECVFCGKKRLVKKLDIVPRERFDFKCCGVDQTATIRFVRKIAIGSVWETETEPSFAI